MPTSSAPFRIVAAISGLALCAGAARAQPREAAFGAVPASRVIAAPPAPSAEPTASPLLRYRMPNGLRVVLDPDRSESSVVVCLTLGVGTRHEPEGKDGAASLLSRFDRADSARARARFRAAGGTWQTQVGIEETQFVALVPPAELETALELAAQRFAPLAASRGAFAGLQNAALRELERAHAPTLEEVGERRARQLVFQGLWSYSHAGPGSEGGLAALELTDLEQLHERFVTPANAVLSMSGLFSEADAKRFLQEHFGRLRARKADAAPEQPLPRQTSERFSAGVDRRASVPLAFYAWPIPAVDADESSFHTLAELLTTSTRLRAAPASGTADIDDVRAWVLPQRGPTALAVRLRVNARSSVDKARSALERELARLASPGPTEVELETARTRITAELEGMLDSAGARAPALAKAELHTGDARWALRRADALAKIESSDIRQDVRTYLNEMRRTTVELYPPGWPQDLPPEVVRREHIVKAGENLIQIASRYHSSVEAIAAANRIKTHRFIFPGQELIIPVKTADLERAKKRQYTVKSGDTLMGIAARFGVSTRALADANRRRRNQPIRIGETLVLPEASREAVAAQKAKAKLRRHRVKRGDSLLGLARRYGVSAAAIAAANGRPESQPILAGELLAIPNASAPSTTPSPPAAPKRARPRGSKPAAGPGIERRKK
jgi:zinc protease